jgi:asparaginyl-tRNA synthetase
MELKSILAKLVRSFFLKKGFIEIFTPYILTASTEGGADQFELDYFGKKAVLAQSCQFYKQAALSCHEKVFGIIPSWRAEKSHTPKHVTEFLQIENEIAFATDQEIMKVQEDLMKNVITEIRKEGKPQLEQFKRKLRIPKTPLKRIPFKKAKDIVLNAGIEEEAVDDFGAPGETYLSKQFPDPFFITKFPTNLMAPEGFGELSSGGQRVADYEVLKNRIIQSGYDIQNFEWYLRMFKYGMPPHAGFGLGFERLVRWIAALPHIREANMFPRTPDIYSP